MPQNWLLLRWERQAHEAGRPTGGYAFYRSIVALLLFTPFVLYAISVASPFMYLFCRSEAATEVLYSWFVLGLQWHDGWNIHVLQLLLSSRRINPKLMPIRVFDNRKGVVVRRLALRRRRALAARPLPSLATCGLGMPRDPVLAGNGWRRRRRSRVSPGTATWGTWTGTSTRSCCVVTCSLLRGTWASRGRSGGTSPSASCSTCSSASGACGASPPWPTGSSS